MSMASKQVIATTVFGPAAGQLGRTYASFCQVPDTEVHAFVYEDVPSSLQHPGIVYHRVQADPAFLSVRRDALFRRWSFPDLLGADHVLVVDGTDVIRLQELPRFEDIVRGAMVAAAPEWIPPVHIPGQGYVSAYLNAGVTFWDWRASAGARAEIVARGRRHYRGPFDDQTTLNEVVHTRYFRDLVILPCQFNWRALYRKDFRSWHHHWRSWPRVDSLDGVVLYHNQHCVDLVLEAARRARPRPAALLPELPSDEGGLSRWQLLWRRVRHRWHYS